MLNIDDIQPSNYCIGRKNESVDSHLKDDFKQSFSHNRITWIDAAKGLAMLIIMWGHVQTASPLKLWLTSFHVPAFLVLSGVLMSSTGNVGGGRKLINKLLRPYITFSVIAIICAFLYYYVCSGIRISAYFTIINIYKTLTGYGMGLYGLFHHILLHV